MAEVGQLVHLQVGDCTNAATPQNQHRLNVRNSQVLELKGANLADVKPLAPLKVLNASPSIPAAATSVPSYFHLTLSLAVQGMIHLDCGGNALTALPNLKDQKFLQVTTMSAPFAAAP